MTCSKCSVMIYDLKKEGKKEGGPEDRLCCVFDVLVVDELIKDSYIGESTSLTK